MSCLINDGHARGCKDNMGGIKYAVLYNFANGQGIASVTGSDSGTYTHASEPIDDGLGTIVDINMEAGKYGYKFVPQKNTSNFTDEPNVSQESGSAFFIPTLNMSFAKYTNTLRNQLLMMARGEVCAVVKDSNNRFWMLGFHNGLNMATGNGAATGSAAADMNGLIIQLVGEEKVPAYEITGASAAAIEAMIASTLENTSDSGFGI